MNTKIYTRKTLSSKKKKPTKRTDWKGKHSMMAMEVTRLKKEMEEKVDSLNRAIDRERKLSNECLKESNEIKMKLKGYENCLAEIKQIPIHKQVPYTGGIGGGESTEAQPPELISGDEARHQLSRAIAIAETGLMFCQDQNQRMMGGRF